jgi:3-methyladenine DNA glycosylase Tag
MKADLSLAELLALVEIVDEHVDRNFPGVDPPRVLREIQQKLDSVIVRHRKEIDAVIKSARKTKSARKG